MSRLLRGTLILTAATFFSKFIGMLYIIPFNALVGTKGLALYGYAYNPYTVLLSIATMGVPLAVSKFVSKYNTLGDYETGRRLLKSGLWIMTATGCMAFLILYLMAPGLASNILGKHDGVGNSVEDITFVIRMVSTALIFVPSMSLIRGYFQGFQSMGPTAVSQVIEQIVRILFILIASYIVIKVMHGDLTTAVGLATFAATVGAVGGLLVLLWYWNRRRPYLKKLYAESKVESTVSLPAIYKEIVSYAVPFVAVGLAIPLYKNIDQFTVVSTLQNAGYSLKKAEAVFAMVTQTSHQLVMIPVSLATAFALTLIPVITKSYTEDDRETLNKQITQSFQITLFLTVPAAIGLSVLAYPAYGTLFTLGDIKLGGQILEWYSLSGIWFAMFTVTAAIMQGLNRQKFALFSMLVGILFKLSLNIPLVLLWQGIGSIIATNIGYTVSILINLYVIKKYGEFSYKWVIRRSILILAFGLAMALVVYLVKAPIEHSFDGVYTKARGVVVLTAGIISGGLVYFFLSYRSGLIGLVLGQRFKFLKRKNQKAT
ncbi:putative polysaccharide biosynthesis protein [Fictibacillus enclensis]|uniref:putative polysaccharide biosynthesis protein n=1 Tax=Fictibacillus enclensis TaxID=1017270 RepID=UPI0024C091F5|nr:polysaccharide biosynthesis protein [Fictibacillus enclensis]WHY70899.1 polysaccharide biosynthesis protein [Fictibacillus enclensis]